jgi:hypothetical protein
MSQRITTASGVEPVREKTEKIVHLNFPPLPISDRTESNDALRCPESFRLAHEGATALSIDPSLPGAGFWAETKQGAPRTFLPMGTTKLSGMAAKEGPVLISGAKGTGKRELALAMLTQETNRRRDKSFVEVDCEESHGTEAVEAELFGRGNKGSEREGKLVACDGGTVLVRNLDRLPLDCGRRLIHFLRHGEVKPLDSDHVRERIDVRVLATTRDESSLPEDLLGEFGKPIRLRPLRDDKRLFTLILAEFFRPYDHVKDVHVSWLLDLLCYDWPGNICELRRYCKKAIAKAIDTRCSVLCATLQPIAKENRDSAPAVGSKHIINSLLALSEKRYRKTVNWPHKTIVSPDLANSLRLLLQLMDDGRSFFRQRDRGPFPSYFHPYKIPMALFFEGCRCPPCYEVTGLFPREEGGLYCIEEFLRKIAAITADPSILSEDQEFRRAFGADPDALTTLKPSESFVNWVGSLRASVPKYAELRDAIVVPALPSAPRKRHTAPPPEKSGSLSLSGLDPRSFRWQNVNIGYDPIGKRIHFGYQGLGMTSYELEKIPGKGWLNARSKLGPVGMVLLSILTHRPGLFTTSQVVKWTRIRGKKLSKEAASRYVNRLNELLWNLYLPEKKGKRHEAIPFVRRKDREGERIVQFHCINPHEDAHRANAQLNEPMDDFLDRPLSEM